MSMVNFLARRLVYSLFVLFGLSIVIFVIARIMPGDPARMAVGARAPQREHLGTVSGRARDGYNPSRIVASRPQPRSRSG